MGNDTYVTDSVSYISEADGGVGGLAPPVSTLGRPLRRAFRGLGEHRVDLSLGHPVRCQLASHHHIGILDRGNTKCAISQGLDARVNLTIDGRDELRIRALPILFDNGRVRVIDLLSRAVMKQELDGIGRESCWIKRDNSASFLNEYVNGLHGGESFLVQDDSLSP